MTAPLLSTRDTLAKTLPCTSACDRYTGLHHLAECVAYRDRAADTLLASGAVTDVTTLADDDALVEAVAADQKEAADSWGDPLPGAELGMRARTALRALAKALTERDTP